jgi:uncharacterized membrane protein YfcA
MIPEPSLPSLLVLTGALLGTGIVAGLLAGLLGVGGGIVIVPVLFHLFSALDVDASVRMHVAVGTSLATIVPTSIVSAAAHRRRDAVDLPLLRTLGPAVFAGVIAGTAVAASVRGILLTAIFGVLALAVAANMALRPEELHLRDTLPGRPALDLIGGLIGAFSAMMGIGGGTFSVPVLVACAYPIRKAVGTASAIGLIIGVPGAIGFVVAGLEVPARPPFSFGYVNLLGFALIVPATILAAPWGVRLAHAIRPVMLRRAFALFLFLTSLRMLSGLVR